MAFKKFGLSLIHPPHGEMRETEKFPALYMSPTILEQPYTSSYGSSCIKSYFLVYVSAESSTCLEICFYYEDTFSWY